MSTRDLRLYRQPVEIQAVGRAGQIFAHAVEAEAEEILDLLAGRMFMSSAYRAQTGMR